MNAKSESIHDHVSDDDHQEATDQSAKPESSRIVKPKSNSRVWPHDWQNDDYWSVEQVARYTTLDRSTIYRLEKKHQFPSPVKLGSVRVVWTSASVKAWMLAKARQPIAG
jgi:predicted DNA-binding transcriptional regulator AlpA